MTQSELICRVAKCEPQNLPNLATLYAGGNSGITDAGLAHVPNLATLDAWGNSGITDAGKKIIYDQQRAQSNSHAKEASCQD